MSDLLLTRTRQLAETFLGGVDERPVFPPATFQRLVQAFGSSIPEEGEEPIRMIEDLTIVLDRSRSGSARRRARTFTPRVIAQIPQDRLWSALGNAVDGEPALRISVRGCRTIGADASRTNSSMLVAYRTMH